MILPSGKTLERALIGVAIGTVVLFVVVSVVVAIIDAPRQARERAVAKAKREEEAKVREAEDQVKTKATADQAQKARYDAKMKYWEKLAGEWDEHEAKWEKEAEERDRTFADRKKLLHAWINATGMVKERLKSPSTANFGTVLDQNPVDCVTPLSSDTYRAQGWVDSQNGSGATVRADFAITVRDKGEAWELVEEPLIVQR